MNDRGKSDGPVLPAKPPNKRVFCMFRGLLGAFGWEWWAEPAE